MSELSELAVRPRRWALPIGRPRVLRTNAATVVALVFWAAIATCALLPSLLAPGDPLAIHTGSVLLAPSPAHPFGTDQFGRDLLGQIVHGAGISILVGITSTAAAVLVGVIVGVVAGYVGGVVDLVVMRTTDVLLCFPGILLALVFQAALGAGRGNIVIAVAVAAAPQYVRLVRGSAVALRERTFAVAARSAGVRAPVVVLRHVLPFLVAPVLSIATIGLGTAIVVAASLSFLGLGNTNGVLDWGALVGSGEQYLSTAWWIVTFPGLVITLVVVCAGVLGDAIGRRLTSGGRA